MKCRTVLITGAAKGIGKETALLFALEGCNLVLVDKDDEALACTVALIEAEYPASVIGFPGDLSEENFLRFIVEETVNRYEGIQVLVNNAAWRTLGSMRTIDLDTWERTLRICLTAPAFLAKYAAEKMEMAQAGGVIVNVSSMMSDRPAGNSPAYIAAKGGIESLTRELAVTYGRNGIRVVCVRPGYIDTALSKDYKNNAGEDVNEMLASYLTNATPLQSPAPPASVAEAIYWLSSEQAGFITGCSLTIDGGFSHNMNSYQMKKRQFPNEY